MRVCYAQHAEDLVLADALPPSDRGFYVDVGAAHPTELSVTQYFYERGWNGINIEPLPHMFAALEEIRPRDINLQVVVGDHDGEICFFRVVAPNCDPDTVGSGLSTCEPVLAEQYRQDGYVVSELRTRVRTLNSILDQYGVQPISFLKVDVEGHEAGVLAGLDLCRFRPRIMLIEAVKPLSNTRTFEVWESGVLSSGYHFAATDGVNRYYVRNEDSELIPKLHALQPSEYLRREDYRKLPFLKRHRKSLKFRIRQMFHGRTHAANPTAG